LIKFNKKTSNIIDKLSVLIENNRMFEISWQGISSGHKAYINIFASIFNELKWIRKTNLLLCIDEGDLYLHPRWQTEFLDRILTFLPEVFGGRIQIILTSHSPFLLSDLPKQSINIFKDDNKSFVLNGNELDHETFAGNIYKLYEEPFFLGNQRLSLFASKKINYILENIDSKKELNKKELNNKELAQYISLIGDDVIRHHLNKRLKND
jgi:predicted ATP-dependent endonuclease of OLD family